MAQADLKAVETHFRFGENWASFARLLEDRRVAAAIASLRRLLGMDLQGKSFLDIGSGSGLSSLAAAKLGAERIVAVDLDPVSVRTTRDVLAAGLAPHRFAVEERSVFALDPAQLGRFDVVYSWGVLHHTGAMWDAVDRAAALVKPDGLLVLALYRKTPMCRAWQIEKRLYAHAPSWLQTAFFLAFKGAAMSYMLMRGKSPAREWANYYLERGMDQDHDIRDWLGGYPYESAAPEEVDEVLRARGFSLVRAHGTEKRSGLMGTGCAEYVYRSAVRGANGQQ